MKQFFKFMLASMTGYLLLWIIMGIILFSMIASIKCNAVLWLLAPAPRGNPDVRY